MKALKVLAAATVTAIAVLGMGKAAMAGGMEEYRALPGSVQDSVMSSFWDEVIDDLNRITPAFGRGVSEDSQSGDIQRQERFKRFTNLVWDSAITTCDGLSTLQEVGNTSYKLSVSSTDTDRLTSAISVDAVTYICPGHKDLFDYQWRQARHDDLD